MVKKESNEVFKSVLVERLQSFMALGQTKPSTFYTFLWTLFNFLARIVIVVLSPKSKQNEYGNERNDQR